jgi:hypothetical protein
VSNRFMDTPREGVHEMTYVVFVKRRCQSVVVQVAPPTVTVISSPGD